VDADAEREPADQRPQKHERDRRRVVIVAPASRPSRRGGVVVEVQGACFAWVTYG
jgi:hypothetical protein